MTVKLVRNIQIFAAIVLLSTFGCNNDSDSNINGSESNITSKNDINESTVIYSRNDSTSQFSIGLNLNQDTISTLDSVRVKIILTNISDNTIHLILDHPTSYTGGLWYDYTFELIDSSDSSVLAYNNTAMLSSITYPSQAEIEGNEYQLAPDKKVIKEFELTSLIMTEPVGKELDEGKYRLRLTKGKCKSNWSEFVIKKTSERQFK